MKKYFLLFTLLMLGLVRAQTWTSTDIGTVGKAGSDSYNSTTGTYTLTGSGTDFWGTADAGHFVYQTISGDGELTARVVSVQNVNAWTKAGVMLRQSTDTGSLEASTLETPGNGVTFQYRTVASQSSYNTSTLNAGAPWWVRIVKDGDLVTSYQSQDGVAWVLMGCTRLTFTGPVDIGLAVTSHNNGQAATATFDNVSLESVTSFAPSSPWIDQDIGAVGTQTGAAHFEDNNFTLYGGGADIWNNADAFNYVYQPLNGDGVIIAEVDGQTNPNSWSKAGVMIRGDLTAGSTQALVAVTPGEGIAFQARVSENGSSETFAGANVKAPYWVKLTRTGNQFYAYQSPDGNTWQLIGTQTIAMPQQAYIGLALCSHNVNATAVAVISGVQLQPLNTTVNSLSDSSVNLIWPSLANPSSVAEYRIERNGVAVATSTTTAYEDIQLTPSTTYSYLIQALDSNGNVLGSTTPISVTTLAPFLPSPWSHLDIGEVGVGGYSQLDAATGTYTLVGAGADIWNNVDAFQFAEQPFTGDGVIIARVDSVSPTNSWTKAGIMIRATNDPSSMHCFLCTTPGNGVNLQARLSTGGSSSTHASTVPVSVPVWLKLIRQGSLITGFQSPDGLAWFEVGSYTVPMTTALEVGLALTSHDAGTLATATIDNVSIMEGIPTETQPPNPPGQPTVHILGDVSTTFTWPAATDPVGVTGYRVLRNGTVINTTTMLSYTDTGLTPGQTYNYTVEAINFSGIISGPSTPLSLTLSASGVPTPWSHQEIGTVALAGTAAGDGSNFTLTASGIDIWNNADSFGFVSQSLSGDGLIQTEVTQLQNTNTWAKGGVMMRTSLDPGAPEVSMVVSAASGLSFQWRTAQGSNSGNKAGAPLAAPEWVRLIRSGTVVTGYNSPDGVNWSKTGQVTIPLTTTVYAGLAVTSHNNGVACTATFAQTEVVPANLDTDGSGLPNEWQIEYFGQLGNNPNSLSPAGDGYTLLQEYQMGRNPLDFYQGATPVLTIVSGNLQTGAPGSILPQPLVVSVMAAGVTNLNNAPITFQVPNGQGLLSASSNGQNAAGSLSLKANAQGQTVVYVQLPNSGTTCTVVATATSSMAQSSVTFTENLQLNPPSLNAFGDSSFALNASNLTFGWGLNDLGQLNLSAITSAYATPTSLGSNYLAIASNGHHSLYLNSDNTLSVVGDNYFGQLGTGDQVNVTSLEPLPGISNVTAVATGEQHTMALLQDGTVMVWGGNSSGQLGIGSNTDSLVPVPVPGLANIVAISCGRLHSVAVDNNGNVYTWGDNRFGQLGNGTYTACNVPIQVATLTNIATISSGDFHNLAIDKHGIAWAWGANQSGQLGLGNSTNSTTPQAVTGIKTITIASCGSEFSLLLANDGTGYGMGANFRSQLGINAGLPSISPTLLPLTGLTQLIAGADHAFGYNGLLYGWGANNAGQLGDGTVIDSPAPVQVVVP